MTQITRAFSTLVILFSAPCLAQDWQIGGGGGYSFYRDVTASNPTGTAQAGFKGGAAVMGIVSHDAYKWVGGEVRYEYFQNDMKVSGNGQEVTFNGQSHAVHYDFILNAAPRGSKVRPFVAVGGGAKFYRGTGNETAFQPLDNLVILTRTSEAKPLLTAGGGVKFQASRRVSLRVEFRDFMTGVPTKVVTPAPGTKMNGWFHNFVPMFGITIAL